MRKRARIFNRVVSTKRNEEHLTNDSEQTEDRTFKSDIKSDEVQTINYYEFQLGATVVRFIATDFDGVCLENFRSSILQSHQSLGLSVLQ